MPGRIDELSAAIGKLGEGIRALEARQEGAAESRKSIHDKLELLGQEMIRANSKITVAQSAIDEMKPVVQDYKNLRANIHGGVIVLGGIGAAVFTILGYFAHEFIGWLRHSALLK